MALHHLVLRLRRFRAIHQWVGISVAAFMLVTSITGVLLGWKKNADVLQPPTQQGGSKNLTDWVSFEIVSQRAVYALDSVTKAPNTIDRMDVRPDKGIIKVLFTKGYWEVQIDGKTGRPLSVNQRHSDWIEHIHDGSIISDAFKLFYTNYLGIGLLGLSLTGFWLWYGPRRIRRLKHQS